MPTLLLILILAIAACAQTSLQDKRDDKTALPFNFGEWVEWQDAIDLTEKEDDGRYKSFDLSEHIKLRQLVDKIYPHYKNTHYFVLESDKTDCVMYIVISKIKGEYGLYFSLINFQGDKEIASLPLGGLSGTKEADGTEKRKNFTITKDLKITLFDEKYFYSEKEERTVVTEKKKTAEYQIQRNCQIVKDK